MSQSLLEFLNITQADLLGEGGEAQVYALDEARVVRIYRAGTTLAGAQARAALLAEITAGAQHLSFETPQVIEVGEKFGRFNKLTTGRIYTIEKRIPGRSLLETLKHSGGDARRALITQYMDAAWQLGTLNLQRPFFGEISHDNPVQTTTLQAYLAERTRRSLAGSEFAYIDTNVLAANLGEPLDGPAFVHLDYFAGNVMADDERLTGVIDFGYSSIIGDRRMNIVAAAAHMLSPRITPTVTEEDRKSVLAWLQERELTAYYKHGERWMAAYWMFASNDDAQVYEWCRSVFSEDSDDML